MQKNSMEIYNTLTRKKEIFEPRNDKKLQMFVCGPTVYDHIHIGNARTFVFFDVVAKYLKYKGYNTQYIQNITDIDNKIIERAEKEGVDSLDYAKKYSDIFKQDMAALGVTSPEYKNATDHIPEVIKQVQTLLDKGNAYVIDNDGIYFDLATFPEYGKLSGRTANMAEDAVSRIDDSDKKRNRGDFALWKFKQDNDPFWPAPFGDGRPGWHIEDTAITEKYFGPQYDIHGGGEDLKFPHHEAEIAQQESASGLKPFVKYWMHVGFLVNKEQKMSKSLGNIQAPNELLKKYPKEVLRLYLLSNYYRSPLDFSEEILNQSAAAVQRISEFKEVLEITDQKGRGNIFKYNNNIVDPKASERMFFESLDNDLNTQEAFGHLFGLIRALNVPLRMGAISKEYAQPILEFLKKVDRIFGIVPSDKQIIKDEILKLLSARTKLRAKRFFGLLKPTKENLSRADKIRKQIEGMGYQIKDTVYGSMVVKK